MAVKASPFVLLLCIAAASASTQPAKQSELLVVGPVENVKALSGVVTVLGRDVATNLASQLAVGEIVEVYGTLSSDGSIANAKVKAKGEYIPGVSVVMTKGVVTATHPSIGTLSIGSALVDYTALLSDRDLSAVTVGETLEVAGIQPMAHGTIVANIVEGKDVVATTTAVGVPGSITSEVAALAGAASSAGQVSIAYAHGGGDSTQYAHGGGDSTQYAHGGGDSTQYAHGGGDSTQYAHGGGDSTQYAHGGGDSVQYAHGGGDSIEYAHGGGDQ
jgi:hypothetical protein